MRCPCVLIAVLLIAATSAPRCAAAMPDEPREAAAEVPIAGAPSAIDPAAAGDRDLILIEPGARLHRRPDVHSPAVALIDAPIELAVLDRRDQWAQVLYGPWKGWVATGGAAAALDAESWAVPEDAAGRLALAREMLGSTLPRHDSPAGRQLGPFTLHTDVEDARLLRFLSRISSHLPAAYRQRYGLESRLAGGDAVVIFAHEEDYRAYEARIRPATDRGALGHAADGIAVLYVGHQGPDEVAAVLIHELTHVLNHRVLAAPPSWLDEGMANDLAFCRIDGARRLVLGSLGGRNVVIEEHSYRPGGWLDVDQAVHLSGPAAARSLLAERWRTGGAIKIEELAALSAGQFFAAEQRQVRYDASAFFVRYLLDGDGDRLAAGFRAFLTATSAGEVTAASALLSYLGSSWGVLEDGFAVWLKGQRPLTP